MRIIGRPRALVSVVLGCLLLASCGSGPSRARAAVLIGDHQITVDEVQQVIDRAVTDQPAAQQMAQQHKLDLLGRAIVGQFVQHEMITRVAQREGLRADPALVAQLANALDQPLPTNGVDPSQLVDEIALIARDHTEAATDYALEQALGAKYFHNLSVTLDFTTVGSDENGPRRDQARAKTEQFAASPNGAHQVIQADQQNGTSAKENVAFSAASYFDTSTVPQSTAIFGVPAGTVVTFEPDSSESTWVVAVVRKRDLSTPVPDSEAQGPPNVQTLVMLGQRLLQQDVERSGVQINPRYGVWDPIAMDVAPSAAEVSGFVLPVKGYVQP